ncbi:MAG: aldo/keto reductase [Niabella sp.]
MNYKHLGATTLLISEIGFGCMSLGKHSEGDSVSLIHQAIDAGINYFDTADIYDAGENEELLGKAICGKRNKLVVATKVGNIIKQKGEKVFDWNPSKKHILQAVEGSLRRLNTDRIDLYQLHGGMITDPIDETIDAFETLQQQGKIVHYGISSIRPNVIKAYVKRSNIASVMMQYSLLDRRPEETALDLLHNHQISVLARGGLAQGLLINKAAKEYLGLSENDVQKAQETLTGISGSVQNNALAAIDFVLKNKAVTSSVIGFSNKEQLNNVLGGSFSLSADALSFLKTAIPAMQYENHR